MVSKYLNYIPAEQLSRIWHILAVGNRSAFQLFGWIGLSLAITLSLRLTWQLDLKLWSISSIVLISISTFLGTVLIAKVFTGSERLIYYHQFITILLADIIFLKLSHQTLLPYLDVTVLGVGLFSACGRVGCLAVGCCYGRPCPWGIRYREEHILAGFPYYFVGVNLLPIQLIESLWLFSLVAVGTVLVLTHQTAGTAFTWYVVSYGVGRFNFEFFRGDADRPYCWGFSQAQWISLILITGTVSAEYCSLLPEYPWHSLALMTLILETIVVIFIRLLDQTKAHRLLHPHHLKEVAEAIQFTSCLTAGLPTISSVSVKCTSLGIQISTNRIKTSEEEIKQYTFSSNREEMARGTATVLAKLIWQLNSSLGKYEIIETKPGIFHLLLRLKT